jgi:deferrochelatase/peroxidase EfeB
LTIDDRPVTRPAEEPPPRGFSRRRLLGAAGVGAAVAGVGVAAGFAVAGEMADGGTAANPPDGVVPFRGQHQAGIITPAQDRLHFAAIDLTTTDRSAIIALLQRWTRAADRMTAGAEAAPGGAVNLNPEAPPSDTGEALGLPASSLTLTFGIGPGFFDKLGLAAQKPAGLAPLPTFQRDQIDPALSGGDLCVQACADDPQVAVHAIRNLARIGFGVVAVRWSQLGFGKTSSTTPERQTPRNMFGFKDGTRNISGDDHAELDRHVWAAAKDGAAWMSGGSYVVARRIRMHIETWDRTSLQEQQDVFGRMKGEGNPYGAKHERDPVPLAKLPADAHVRLAHPDSNGGVRILRRGYSFTDGFDPELGQLDAGLFFIAFQRDAHRQFAAIQERLGLDTLNEYIKHTSSALFAVPPGVRDGRDHVGRLLFERA